jgi:hypothetical protein
MTCRMSFDPASLALSVFLGFVGLALFVYGRKQARVPHIVAGLLLMIYPYFTPTPLLTLGVGVAIGAGLCYLLWMGW